jgi:saccharopine dehydrogenase (NAD+, L-lysine-forming)
MRVLIIGGAGVVGAKTAALLAKNSAVSKVVVADRRKGKVDQVIANVRSKKVSGQVVDINNADALISVMRESDIAMNLVGPYYVHGTKVLTAAIKAKINYIDVCDDYDATADMLKLDAEARKAGITALIGMGAGPGVMNLVAKYGANKCDQVDKIHFYWYQHISSEGAGAGQGLHGFHLFADKVTQFLEGKWVMVPAGSGGEMVKFADIEVECFYVGHSEPVTMPRYIKGVREVYNKACLLPVEIMQEMLKMVELGFGSKEAMKIKGDIFVAPREMALAVQALSVKRKDLGKARAGMRIDVHGKRGGNTVQYTYMPGQTADSAAGSVDIGTSLPFTIAALMLVQGEIRTKGVVAPEGCIDPKLFLSRLKIAGGLEFLETECITKKLEL